MISHFTSGLTAFLHRDLLHPDVPSKDIGLREDAQGRIFFVGAREEAITNLDQAFSFLNKGLRCDIKI